MDPELLGQLQTLFRPLIMKATNHWGGYPLLAWENTRIGEINSHKEILDKMDDLFNGKCNARGHPGVESLGQICNWCGKFHCINYCLDYTNGGWGKTSCLPLSTDGPATITESNGIMIKCWQTRVKCISCSTLSQNIILKLENYNKNFDMCRACVVEIRNNLNAVLLEELTNIIMTYMFPDRIIRQLQSDIDCPQDWFSDIPNTTLQHRGVMPGRFTEHGYRDNREESKINTASQDEEDFM